MSASICADRSVIRRITIIGEENMKEPKRLLGRMTAFLLCCALLTGCSQKPTDPGRTEPPSETEPPAASENETEPEETEPSIWTLTGVPEGTTYDGWTFNALVYNNQSWGRGELCVEELTGEVLNDAYFNRNLYVENLLGITITQDARHHESLVQTFTNSVTAGDNAYSAGWLRQRDAAACAMNKTCLDLNLLTLDLGNPWWDYHSIQDTTMGGKNYLVATDITIADKDAIWPVYFHKGILEEEMLENPYELVNAGKWTFDKLREMAAQAMKDLDGDGVMDRDKDRFGYVTHEENYAASWMACGERLVGIDEEGIPFAAFESERFVDVYNKIYKTMNADYCYWRQIGVNGRIFSQGRALFLNEVISGMRYMREYEFDFGVLPLPKYDEVQDSYHTYVAEGAALMIVPKTIDDVDRLGRTLEILGYTGRDQILPAYYEINLKTRDSRDVESGRMLDICLNTRCYDLGVMFDWGGIVMTVKTGMENVTRIITAKGNLMKTSMAKAFKVLDIEVPEG